MATIQIKDYASDNQAGVNSSHQLMVTGTFTPSGTTNVNILEVGGVNFTLGQTTMSLSLPVTIASNQAPIPITGSIIATNPSIGINGATAPTSSTQVGAFNSSGNLVALSVDPLGRLLVDTTGTSVITGTVNTNLNGLNAFLTTQYLIGTSATQVVIPAGTSSVGLKVKTTTNTDAVLVGATSSVTNVINGTGNGYALFNGDAVQIDVTNSATMWLIGTSAGQFVYVIFAGA